MRSRVLLRPCRPFSAMRSLAARRRHVGCSAQLQKDAPAEAPRDDMAARALEFFGLRQPPQQVGRARVFDACDHASAVYECSAWSTRRTCPCPQYMLLPAATPDVLLLQAGNNAVPMRPGTGASPSLQAMRERAREAAEAALAEQSAPEHTTVRALAQMHL